MNIGKGLCILLSVASSLMAESAEDWVESSALKPSEDAIEWTSAMYRDFLERNLQVPSVTDDGIVVCLSSSVPETYWLQIGKAIEGRGRVVLRGIPPGGLKNLVKKIHALNSRGFRAPIQIDPMVFREHSVQAVPCFIYEGKRLTGAVSLDYAMDRLMVEDKA